MQGVRVGIVGCGRMGCSIAAYLAICECQVLVFDETEFTRVRALQSINGQLAEAVQQNLLRQEHAEAAQARVKVAESLEAVANVELLVEAVPDDLALKQKLLSRLDEIAAPECILTTNSINYMITDVMTTDVRHACCGLRFLYPVMFIDRVEVSSGREPIWGQMHAQDDKRVRPAARVTALLKHMGLSPFEYRGGERFLLSPAEVERCHRQQRERVLADGLPKNYSSTASFYSDGSSHTFDEQFIASGTLQSEEGECTICCETKPLGMVLPCGHTEFCYACAATMIRGVCAVCRQRVERVVPKTV